MHRLQMGDENSFPAKPPIQTAPSASIPNTIAHYDSIVKSTNQYIFSLHHQYATALARSQEVRAQAQTMRASLIQQSQSQPPELEACTKHATIAHYDNIVKSTYQYVFSIYHQYTTALARAREEEARAQAMRSNLIQCSGACMKRTAPIHQLPYEVLQITFLITAHMEWEDEVEDCRAIWPSISWIIAQVCRHWRYVAIGTPELWSHIHFTIPSDIGSSLFIAQTYIKRARNFPLTSIVRVGYEDEDEDVGYFNRDDPSCILLHSVLPYSRVLFYEGSGPEMPIGIAEYGGKLELLTTLHIRGDGDYSCVRFNSPRLQRLTMSVDAISSHSWPIGFPWSQLTSFSLFNSNNYMWRANYEACHDLFRAISQATALETFQLKFCPNIIGRRPPNLGSEGYLTKILCLEHLRHIALAMDAGFQKEVLPSFLAYARFPNLQTATIDFDNHPLLLDVSTGFSNMFQFSGCKITSLTLTLEKRSGAVAIRTLFLATPSIQKLKIMISDQLSASDSPKEMTLQSLLQMLTLQREGYASLPMLRSLVLWECTSPVRQAGPDWFIANDYGKAIIRMLRSRRSPCIDVLTVAFDYFKAEGPLFTQEERHYIFRCRANGRVLNFMDNWQYRERIIPELDWHEEGVHYKGWQ